MSEKGLYSIGQVGKVCDVSSRTLRYYEEVGLLQPDVINAHNGYRYYNSDSMYRVQVIRYLSDEGFKLEEIRQILEEDDLLKLRDIFAEKIQKTRQTIDYFKRREESLRAWFELFVEGEWVQRHGSMTPTAKYVPLERYLCYDSPSSKDMTDENDAYIEASYKAFSKHGGHAMVDVGGAVYVKFVSFRERMMGTAKSVAFMERLQPGSSYMEHSVLMGGFTAVSGYHIGAVETVKKTYEMLVSWAEEHHFALRGDSYERRIIDAYSVSEKEHYVTELILPVEEDVSGFLMHQSVEKD